MAEIGDRRIRRRLGWRAVRGCLAVLAAAALPAGAGRAAAPGPGIISTVAGYNQAFAAPDSASTPALQAMLELPGAVACDAAGNLYVSEYAGHRVCRIDAGGHVSTIAGTGTAGFSGDQGPADQAELNTPFHLAFDAGGSLYIDDSGNRRIRRVDPNGIITTAVGGGTKPPANGIGALDVELQNPSQIAPLPDGSLLVVDRGWQELLKVAPDGTLRVIAGTGKRGNAGDGGPATQAQFQLLAGVAVDPAGNIYVSDADANVIRKIGPDGIIRRYAGTGRRGFSGDGGPALAAQLRYPWGLGFSAGELYVVDAQNQRIRKVRRDGIIVTVAGNGKIDSTGDGGPATQAAIECPAAVAFGPYGNLYVNDATGSVRKVTFPPLAPGDVNGDGAVTLADVILALRMTLGLEVPVGRQLQALGADPRLGVRLPDVIRLLRRVVG